MNKEKAIKLYDELRANCPGLILSGSALRGKQEGLDNLDLILVGRIFPLHLLPVGHMEPLPKVQNADILSFKYRDEKIDVYRTDEDSLGAMKLHLTGPKEYGIYTRMIAKKKGMKLNQYGLFKNDKLVASKTEEEILSSLGLKYLEPFERDRFRSLKMQAVTSGNN
jgi:hypothetical protein